MLFAAGLIIVAIGALISFVSPNRGLLFYMVWFMVRPQEIWVGLGGAIPLERILVLALLASLFIHHRLLKAKPFHSTPLIWAFLGFTAVNYLSIPTSVWRGGALTIANDLGKTLVFYFCIINLVTTTKELRKFLWAYQIGVGWLAASSLWAFGDHRYFAQGIERATSLGNVQEVTWGDPNTTASNLALAIPFLLALFIGTKSFLGRVVLGGLLVLDLTCILFTGSRGGLLETLLVFLLMALWSSKRWTLLAIFIFSLPIIWLVIPQDYRDRYETLLLLGEDLRGQNNATSEGESAFGRVIGFEVGMQMFLDRPIIGVGAGDFPAAWFDRNTPYSYNGYKGWHQPHNLPGQLLGELGILGAISFGYYIFTMLRLNRATRRALRELRDPPRWLIVLSRAVAVTIFALFVGGISSHNLYRYNWYIAGAIVAVLARLHKQQLADEASPDSGVLPAQDLMPAVGAYSYTR